MELAMKYKAASCLLNLNAANIILPNIIELSFVS